MRRIPRFLIGVLAALVIVSVALWGVTVVVGQALDEGNRGGLFLLLVIACIPFAIWGLSADD